ncbi:MAG: acyl carrier protein [Granulosicoccus sp.]|jgi:acyl carrier protein
MSDTLNTISDILNNLSPEISFDASRDCDVKLLDLGVDSLDNMSLFLEIQERLGLDEIADADIDSLTSVNIILGYVQQRLDRAA